MLRRSHKANWRQLLRSAGFLHHECSRSGRTAHHGANCSCIICIAALQCQPLSFQDGSHWRGFATNEEPPRDEASSLSKESIHEEADEALRKLPRIRPPTRDAAGSEQLPIAAATPPSPPLSDTIVRRLLGERGVVVQRHIEGGGPKGSFGNIFSESLKNIRLEGLNIDESWDGLLAKWDLLLDEKKYDVVLREMQEKGGRENELLATLYRDITRRQEADQRALRHAQVEQTRAAIAASRVVKLDELGRAYATGKRKTSIARVWIRLVPEGREYDGKIRINGRHFDDYIKPWMYRDEIVQPFEVTDTLGLFDVMANVHGGGVSGQASAIRHGISKALQCYDPELRFFLRPAGLLKRDARVVERKKPGKAKARKSFQWVKR